MRTIQFFELNRAPLLSANSYRYMTNANKQIENGVSLIADIAQIENIGDKAKYNVKNKQRREEALLV